MGNEFAHSIGCSYQWISFFCCHQRKTACLGCFYNSCSVGCNAVTGKDGAHQRIVYFGLDNFSVQGRDEGFKHAFSDMGSELTVMPRDDKAWEKIVSISSDVRQSLNESMARMIFIGLYR